MLCNSSVGAKKFLTNREKHETEIKACKADYRLVTGKAENNDSGTTFLFLEGF